jgi:hypothetical protein
MPLDDTRRPTGAKPAKTAAAPTKPDAFLEARADLDREYLALLGHARSAKDKTGLKYWHTTEAERLDGREREEAKLAAIKGGVFPDLKLNPLEAGTKLTVYSSKLLTIGLQVDRRPAATDVDKMVAFLEKSGVKPSLLKLAVKRNTPKAGVANVYTALLVTG